MLREVRNLVGFAIAATDGDIGHTTDFYFDDAAWVIRYLIVATGSWLSNRKVLISPLAIGEPNWHSQSFPARLTREQVRDSPDIDTDEPVSRQHELEYAGFYRYPYYWAGSGIWGAEYYPDAMLTGTSSGSSGAEYLAAQVEANRLAGEAHQRDVEHHLRSCHAVTGYHISAADGEIGHLQGMLVDEESWAIRYLIVNTSNWWLGNQVLVAPAWITNVSWAQRTLTVDVTRHAIKDSPPYDPTHLPDRPQETLIHEHYGRNGYWQSEIGAHAPARQRGSEAHPQR